MDSDKVKHLNIISFNVPYPPDYGGIIDVFNKIKWLSEAGISIYLHAFTYNRPADKELEKYCKKVYYYRRKTGLRYQLSHLPYIVISRKNEDLIKNLLKNNYPILFEGLHTCYYLTSSQLNNRLKLVRTHNIEHRYYAHLAASGGDITTRLFHIIESFKLKFFEKRLKYADYILSISSSENDYFNKKYNHSVYIPPFHAFENSESATGTGKYILLHGNLSVAENFKAIYGVLPIIRKTTNHPVIIAGKDPGKEIFRLARKYSNTSVIASPGIEEMYTLIKNSDLVILHTSQSTGIKLKLIESLYLGRFVIANNKMLKGSGLDKLCEIANTQEELSRKIDNILKIPFDQKMLNERREMLSELSNLRNAKEIYNFLELKVDLTQ